MRDALRDEMIKKICIRDNDNILDVDAVMEVSCMN